jgi:hypothetical protein
MQRRPLQVESDEGKVEDPVVSSLLYSLGDMESTYEWNCSLLIDKA